MAQRVAATDATRDRAVASLLGGGYPSSEEEETESEEEEEEEVDGTFSITSHSPNLIPNHSSFYTI